MDGKTIESDAPTRTVKDEPSATSPAASDDGPQVGTRSAMDPELQSRVREWIQHRNDSGAACLN